MFGSDPFAMPGELEVERPDLSARFPEDCLNTEPDPVLSGIGHLGDVMGEIRCPIGEHREAVRSVLL